LSLDLSKKRTGWAFWAPGQSRPVFGSFGLGDEYSPPGKVFAKLHGELSDLHRATGFVAVRYEQPADPQHFARTTAFEVPFLLIGLAAHVNSFCAALGIRRCDWTPAATWRRHFIGPMKRGTKRMDLKDFVMQRCRDLGMAPRNDDEADAIGLLDYDLHIAGIQPPWRMETVLTPELVAGGVRG
jgi:hypothetical protein